jgi:ribonuclease HI
VKRKAHSPRGARLFGEPQQPADVHIAHVDGAARGNPGPASYAVIVHDAAGREVYRLGKQIGRSTNNVAEYHGLIAALDYAASHGLRRLRIRSDSELLVRQMQGLYKVKSADLKPLHERAQKLARGLEYFAIEHVRRESNSDADALANEALDGPRRGVAAGFSLAQSPSSKNSGLKAAAAKRIRAIYRGGALHPAEPLDLPDGASVELTVHESD